MCEKCKLLINKMFQAVESKFVLVLMKGETILK